MLKNLFSKGLKTVSNSVKTVSNSIKTSEGYYYIFYSNNELIKYQKTLDGIDNKITNFINKLLEEDNKYKFNESLDPYLTFKNINSIFYNGFRLKYDGTKLKYNSFDNPKMKLAINLIENKNIANIIAEKINISSIFNPIFNEISKYGENKKNKENKEKIINLIEKIKSIDKIKNKEIKIKFIQNLFKNKNFILKKNLNIKNINNLLNNTENRQLNVSNKMYLNCENNIKIINKKENIKRKCFNSKKNILEIEKLNKDALNIIKYLRKKFNINIDSYLIIKVEGMGNKFIHNEIFLDEIKDNLQNVQNVNILEIKNSLFQSIQNEKKELIKNSISKNPELFNDVLSNKILNQSLMSGGLNRSFISLKALGSIIAGLVLFILGYIGIFFSILLTKIKSIIRKYFSANNENNKENNERELKRRTKKENNTNRDDFFNNLLNPKTYKA